MKEPESGTRSPAPLIVSLVGEGDRCADLRRWLEFLAGPDEERAPRISQVTPDGLLDEPREGLVLIDADALQVADSGLVERRIRRDGAHLCLFGTDPARALVARLLRLSGARWLAWPPDVESLRALLEAHYPHRAGSAVLELERRAAELADERGARPEPPFELRPPGRRGRAFGLEPGELDEIEAILRGEEPPAAHAPTEVESSPELEDDEAGAFDELEVSDEHEEPDDFGEFEEPDTLEDALERRLRDLGFEDAEDAREVDAPSAPRASSATPPVASAPAAPAPAETPVWFKDQVADLADHVQRLELGLARAGQEGVPVLGPRGQGSAIQADHWRELSDEAARLGQFTRTLGYLAAPPGPGGQLFDLRTLLEEMLRSRAADEGSPRLLVKAAEVLPVRSDKTLLLQAFDALLFLARACAGAEGTVRVRAAAVEENGAPRVEVSIHFPRGPLADVRVADALRPYGLRRVLPELGPNALAAARGILRGQGGRSELVEDGPGALEWRVSLPRVSPGG